MREITEIIKNRTLSAKEKRNRIATLISKQGLTKDFLPYSKTEFIEKELAIIMEACESLSAKELRIIDKNWLEFAVSKLNSENNNLKREAARVIGNIAHLFPTELSVIIPILLANIKDDSTVIRWSAAYAFAGIGVALAHTDDELFTTMQQLAAEETNNGVKNQLLKGLRKVKEIREANHKPQ